MITLDTFIKEWTGKPADYDGHYGPQCVDIIRFYLKEVLGKKQLPPTANRGAKEIWDKYDPDDFQEIHNTPERLPKKGDIMIWGGRGYGHIGIFVSGNLKKFVSFDQNYPAGSKCHLQEHDYSGLIGWLRKKESSTEVTEVVENLKNKIIEQIKIIN